MYNVGVTGSEGSRVRETRDANGGAGDSPEGSVETGWSPILTASAGGSNPLRLTRTRSDGSETKGTLTMNSPAFEKFFTAVVEAASRPNLTDHARAQLALELLAESGYAVVRRRTDAEE